MKKYILSTAALAATLLAGCGGAHSSIGLVDIQRLTANWPLYNNASAQLMADERAVETGKGSAQQKQREVMQLEKKYSRISNQLVTQIRDAATKIAQQKQLKLVLTKEYIGYGGTDITPEVEKALGITEKATPTP